MSDEVAKKGITGHVGGWIKGVLGLFVGVGSGVVVMYSNAIVNQVVKPTRPVANFAVTADGLTVTCQNHASGDSGWWDFGDGSTLDPFDAGQQTQTHAYAKPGTYSVKLTVRNFMMEENERAVPVDLTTPPQTLPPTITALNVTPLGNAAVVPAGFRVTGSVQNADRVIFDMGDDKMTVETQSGDFDKFVVIEKPGSQTIRLTGLAGKTAVKREATVEVKAASVGSVSVVVKVTDTGTQVEKRSATQTVSVPLPKKGEARFERPVAAQPGFTIATADIAAGKLSAVVKNVKLELQPDRKAGKVVGDWAVTGDALSKVAGNADVMVPVTLHQERSAPVVMPTETVSAVVNAAGQVTAIALPPRRIGLQNAQRKIELQVARANPDGSQDTLAFVHDLKPDWAGATASRPGIGYSFGAKLSGDQLQLQMFTKR